MFYDYHGNRRQFKILRLFANCMACTTRFLSLQHAATANCCGVDDDDDIPSRASNSKWVVVPVLGVNDELGRIPASLKAPEAGC
jgi:hypothetical protein